MAFAAHAQVSITPQQVYVNEAQETFVTLTGTNLTGSASTVVEFAGNAQVYDVAPSTASSTTIVAWLPLDVAANVGQYTVTVIATDTGASPRTVGPTAFFVVTRSANAPPLLALPEVVVADATSSSGAFVMFDAGSASCDHASGSLFPVGTTTVTCTASNSFGTSSGTFTVVVTNGSPSNAPSLGIPEVVVAEATSASGAIVTFSTGGATCDHTSGATYPVGTTTVTCNGSNGFGTSTATFSVVVTDLTPPTLNLPANIQTGNATVTYTATATDLVDGTFAAACTPPSGSTFANGITTVTCSATDAHGNSLFGSFTVTVTLPQLTDFTASQNVYQVNLAGGETVTYTSNVPVSLTETLTIRNAAGSIVRTLFNGTRAAGTYQDVWNGTNDAEQLLPDGVYSYVAVVTANGASFTWDDGTHFAGTTQTQLEYPKCRNDAGVLVACNDASVTFDPYTNKPLRINYCVGAGTPPTCNGTTPFIVIVKPTSVGETDATCRTNDCALSEYQSSGAHEFLWYGRSFDGATDLSAATGLTVIRRNDIWPRNRTLLYGTAPVVSSLVLPWAVFNPAAATSSENGEAITLTVSTFQSRMATVTAQFKNLSSSSVLRTMTTSVQAGGAMVLTWDGRADNGTWVAPGLYEITLVVSDTSGSSTVLKPLIVVRYE